MDKYQGLKKEWITVSRKVSDGVDNIIFAWVNYLKEDECRGTFPIFQDVKDENEFLSIGLGRTSRPGDEWYVYYPEGQYEVAEQVWGALPEYTVLMGVKCGEESGVQVPEAVEEFLCENTGYRIFLFAMDQLTSDGKGTVELAIEEIIESFR